MLVRVNGVIANTDILKFLAVKSIGLSISNINISSTRSKIQSSRLEKEKSDGGRDREREREYKARENISNSLRSYSEYGSLPPSGRSRIKLNEAGREGEGGGGEEVGGTGNSSKISSGGEKKTDTSTDEIIPRSLSDSSLESLGLLM